jgi:hypothetical protein
MIKVKIDRPEPNVFFVEDGYTVSYPEDTSILEVLNEDDETIAVFRDWLWAMPATEEDLEEDLPPVPQFGVVETVEVELDPEYVSYAHMNNHGGSAAPGDETEAPTS